MSNKHKKIAQKCMICKKEPAYFSKLAGGYVCQTHAVKIAKKALMALAVATIVIMAYSII